MTTRPGNRLYVPVPLGRDADVRLNDERSHYAARVLRLKVGDGLVLFNGDGNEFTATVREVSRSAVTLNVGHQREHSVESPLKIHLVQGVSRGDRMDIVVQKATELGVSHIAPVTTNRSVVRLDGDKGEKRTAHWSRVAQSACEQCGRNVVPLVDAPLPFSRWIERPARHGSKRVVLHPGSGVLLPGLSQPAAHVELLIGPEGGLSTAEMEQAVAAGFTPCSLGPRILRTETAAIAAIAILQSHYGDLK